MLQGLPQRLNGALQAGRLRAVRGVAQLVQAPACMQGGVISGNGGAGQRYRPAASCFAAIQREGVSIGAVIAQRVAPTARGTGWMQIPSLDAPALC